MVKCEYCGQRNKDTLNICPYCGAPLPVPECSQEEEATPTYNETTETTGNNDSSLFEKTLASIGALAAASTLRKQPIRHRLEPGFDRRHDDTHFRDMSRHGMPGGRRF